ncbi:hypothetical protein [Ruminococcus albus]|uniref:Uncharacterized protein n=1 Tax=Ruminococcus albus TaxID=1264 RepID=A0A1H7FS81_RUMAL|nr:hypothetical protein [Ruminococcus albus]SEK28751.1 hypothetical protein SAMN05216469_101381 [Ruminococcus albus]
MEKKIRSQMSIMMGITLSLCLSFVGTFTSGNFTPVAFMKSFLESLVISLVIGYLVPMKLLEDKACEKAGITGKHLPCRALGSLISDLIYTPIITIFMVTINFVKIPAEHRPTYIIMLGKSMLISFVVAYLIVFLVADNFMKLILKSNGVGRPPEGGRPDMRKK